MIINLSRIDFGGVATGGKSKPEEVFDVQPTTTDQTITPTEGSVFSGGTVRAVTSEIDNNIVPGNIKEGVSILGVAGTLPAGDTPDYRYMKGTIDKDGLRAIGWTDEDILTYEQNIPPHFTWQNDQYKVSDENKALYLLDDPKPDSYKNDPTVTFVPNKNMKLYFAQSGGFRDMKYIKGIPLYDTSNVDSMGLMFYNCYNLITIPQLNTSNVKYINGAFTGCTSLTSIPLLDTSSVITMSSMFQDCKNLITIPQLDTSKVTDMQYMFRNCTRITGIPQLDTSNVTNIGSMFFGCSSLITIPLLDISNTKSMYQMFQNCNSLITIPQLNTSNITNMEGTFSFCKSLTTIPSLDTSKVTTMKSMFSYCDSLTTVEGIDFSGFTSDLTYLFGYTSSMPKITRFIVNGKINVSISDNYSIKPLKNIDYDSVKSILEAANRTDNTNAKTLAFDRTITDRNGELAALVTQCAAKGWTISGLTLQ